MKRFWLIIMAALLVTAIAVPAFAWEFSMTGEFEYRMQYYSRTGEKDIFGDANLQEAPNAVVSSSNGVGGANWIGLAGPNIYVTGWSPAGANQAPILQDNAAASRVRITRGGFARWNNDAFYTDQRLTFNPSIRVNNAIRIHGVYNVGGLRQKYVQSRNDATGEFSPGAPPFERYYMLHSSDAAYNTGAIGSWEQVRATIQMPIGIFSIGMKDFPFGVGAVYANNVRTDSFLAVVPYGPFRLLFGFWPGQGIIASSYITHPDTGTKYDWRLGAGLTYDCGNLSLGLLPIYQSGHFLYRHLNPTGNPAGTQLSRDLTSGTWLGFLKYTNGRFFLNADYFVANQENHWVKTTAPLAVPANAMPTYTEGYTFFAEAGVLAGPTKLSLMYASVSGPVWNNFGAAANANFRQSKAYGGTSVNYQVLQPYSYLMFPIYGGGNNTFNADGTGQMSDAFAFGARLDYATAANLNFFGSFLWAHRLENAGTYAGQYFASSGAEAAVPSFAPTAATANQWINYSQTFKGGGANTNPYVDDGFIGWEAQAGVSWKLLEGLTMDFAYSYWRLGEWFDQAYQAFTPIGANGGGYPGNYGQGIQQGRDPIQSLRGSFTINF